MRKAMTANEVANLSQIICERIMELSEFDSMDNICTYMTINNEVDLSLIMDKSLKSGKNLYLPRVIGDDMEFFKFEANTGLKEGAYGIKEPDSQEILVPNDKTLIIMPGSVYSEDKNRIGYGGGYYDRYLSKHPQCYKLGVCYDFQLLEQIPSEEFDVKPDVIITEKRQI